MLNRLLKEIKALKEHINSLVIEYGHIFDELIKSGNPLRKICDIV